MDDGRAARRFHESTKHSFESLRTGPHALDWPNQPLPFKIFRNLAGEALPRRFEPGRTPAIEAIAGRGAEVKPDRPLGRAALARLLHFSLGIVRERRFGDGRSAYFFRAAACTGALYHVDAYVVCGALADLEPGVYHFGPHDFSLRRLRQGDFRRVLADAAGGEPALAAAPATIVLASTYWRNAWKYQARAYRHVFWDGGTALSQLVAQSTADEWPWRVVLGFGDQAVERLLALDRAKEGVIALVPIGAGASLPPGGEVPPLSFETEPLSQREIDYPAIRDAHSASSLADGEAARHWRERAAKGEGSGKPPPPASSGSQRPSLSAEEAGENWNDPLETVILRRGSARRFRRDPISRDELRRVLEAASAPLSADYRAEPAESLVDLFVIALAVDGLEAGRYRFERDGGSLERVASGASRDDVGRLALGQALAADAAANVYAIADLDRVLGALGERGYRAAALDGGISGGRTYLAAYAGRLAATGLTFFDDQVADYFALDPKRFGVMFLTAFGHAARSARSLMR